MRKQIELHVCDYCHREHQALHTSLEGFDYTKKFSVQECVGCGWCMCADCVENSKKYIQDSKVEHYKLYLCADCVLKKRSDMEYRTFVLDTIEKHEKYMRISLRKTVLTGTIVSSWPWPMWSNNTLTSPWLQKRNAPKAPWKAIGIDSVSSWNSLVTSR